MKRFVALGFVLASFGGVDRAYAQEGPAGAGRAEITFIPAGAVLFTENKDASAPSFSNYQFGGGVTYNINRFIGVEGEVTSSIGISQSLDFGYPSTVRTPDVLNYTGNVVVSLANGSSVVPYVTGGVGGLSLFSREAFGINETETLFAEQRRRRREVVRGALGTSRRLPIHRGSIQRRSVGVLRPGGALRAPRVRRGDAERRPMMVQAALNGTRTRAEHPRHPDYTSRASHGGTRLRGRGRGRDSRARPRRGRQRVARGRGRREYARRHSHGVPGNSGRHRHRRLDHSRTFGIASSAIRSWTTLPDFASVNLHEAGAAQVIELLLERGASALKPASGMRPQPCR